jgi:hypothetical protein
MKLILSLAAVLALALPAAAPAHKAQGPAVKACKAERTENPTAFQAKYANQKGKRAMRRCVRQHVRAARTTCKAERTRDAAAFKAKYANENGKRAFRRCVRAHAGDPLPA